MTSFHPDLEAVRQVVDDAWVELQRSPHVQLQLGTVPSALPDLSLEEAERRAALGKSLLDRLARIDLDTLPHDLALTARLVRFRAQTWSKEADWYWLAVDPRGIGSFGMFLPTAYTGGYLLNFVHNQLASFSFENTADTDKYLSLVADYPRLIDQFTARTAGQAKLGIRMPKVQVMQARGLLTALRSSAKHSISVVPERLEAVDAKGFSRQLDVLISTSVEPAFDRALGGLSDDYLSRAPDGVGIGQYPGGERLYADLVRLHTTLDLSADQVHATGLLRMKEIESSMREIRSELGFSGGNAEFIAHLNTDSRWRADTVDGVAAVFRRYMDRVEPHVRKFFPVAPRASCQVVPLPTALQGSMTYGYYDTPRRDRPEGRYLFNSGNLTKQSLFYLAALTYHELIPGHHLHFASQQENDTLHPFRKYNFVNAYNEGWAEYAAAFAGEIGLYEEPEERYGRLVLDAFLTCRLVVDTGMNVLGWSLERARDYMRQYSGMSESEIQTETLRYSCDRPAQALAYKLGDTRILALREQMRTALGERFEISDFHAAILGPGALPIPELEWHIGREIEGLRK